MTHEPLVTANDKNRFIRHAGHQAPAKFSRESHLRQSQLTVMDSESAELVQLLRLHDAIDHTVSATGSATLLRSLTRPSADLGHIRSKQESLREIASDDALRRALADCVRQFAREESTLYKFFNKGLYALFPYPDFKKVKESAGRITKMARSIPRAESPYLDGLISDLRSSGNSSVGRMMNGAVYKTFGGLKSDAEVGWLTPKREFHPRRFTKWMLAGPAVALAPLLQQRLGFGQSLSPLMTQIGIVWTGLSVLYGLFVKPISDTERFVEPLRKKSVSDNPFSRAIDAIGMMDELLSCHQFAAESPFPAVLPKVTDADRHHFEATGLRSPVLAKENADVVPNHVRLNGARLTFLSGPNSGGKTTICKSIVHNQLLAQIGSHVLAETAAINIADKISYQAPKFDGLQDDEGRFGTELARTRDIFYSTRPKSLVILDELAEGTTYEERLHESFEILSDFFAIGNNTILVTHNHSLADRFTEAGKGQCLMAEFDGNDPTYRIIPGISRVSHADRIAKKIGFSKADRRRYLRENGYG